MGFEDDIKRILGNNEVNRGVEAIREAKTVTTAID